VEVNQIWKSGHFLEMVLDASKKFKSTDPLGYPDDRSHIVCMVKILAPSGYHQNQDIAEALGLEFDENIANEWDWDAFQQEIQLLRTRRVGNLHACIELPDGLFFSFGYDQEGNFGLVLRREGKDKGKRLSGPIDICRGFSKEKDMDEEGGLS